MIYLFIVLIFAVGFGLAFLVDTFSRNVGVNIFVNKNSDIFKSVFPDTPEELAKELWKKLLKDEISIDDAMSQYKKFLEEQKRKLRKDKLEKLNNTE